MKRDKFGSGSGFAIEARGRDISPDQGQGL